jgi:hypothetical protein
MAKKNLASAITRRFRLTPTLPFMPRGSQQPFTIRPMVPSGQIAVPG